MEKDYFSNPFEKADPFETVRQSYRAMQSGSPQTGGGGDALSSARQRIARLMAREAANAPQISSERVSADPHGHGASGPAGSYTPGMLQLRDYIAKKYGIKNVGGYADRNVAGTSKKSDHASWRAWDFMVGNDRAKGDAIADYVTKNYQRYGVKNLIWHDRSWNPRQGWRDYRHPGGGNSPTLQHRDHPHVGFD